MRRVPAFTALLVACGLSASLTGCATNPATGERQLILVSEGQEISMGRQYDQQVVQAFGLVEDPALQAYVQDLGRRMAATSERPNLPWTFRVIDDPVVNAFALPGGFIYITRGILAHFGSEAQLAAVLGHEIGHVTARHSASQMSTQQLAQIGLVAGVILKPELADYAGLAAAGLQVLFLKHSRDDERQADDLGLRYMTRARFDPREMPDVFTMLERVSAAAGGGRVPEWLATHPNPENRRERIVDALAQGPQDYAGFAINRGSYLQRLDGMVFGANPREGYFKDNAFHHPDLKFRFLFPAGWTTQNQRSAVIGVSDQQDAAMQITLAEGATPDVAARQFYAQEGIAGRHVASAINGLRAEIGTFRATTQQGTLDGAVAFVAHDGRIYRLLGYSTTDLWPRYEATVQRSIRSFARETDAAVLAVEPRRLSIVRSERAARLSEFASRSTAPLETLSLLNQVPPTGSVPPGDWVKLVVGGRLP